jgi:hypothetical protein
LLSDVGKRATANAARACSCRKDNKSFSIRDNALVIFLAFYDFGLSP